jgi:hypothetical protein
VSFIDEAPYTAMYFVNMIINLCFFFDLCLNFNLMYYDEKNMRMCASRWDVAMHYFRGRGLHSLTSELIMSTSGTHC